MADLEKQIQAGTIQSKDSKTNAVNVRAESGILVFIVDKDTTITVNGFYRNFSDLTSGQKIRRIYYKENNESRKIATIIHAIDEKLLEKGKMMKKPLEQKDERKPAI